ncbi:MAG TPA: gliding motility-associated C-terminal domain-containing protein, partial [Chitinophagales bacterium]|nr:gliding motility-associated C-terminal domain-containing protein [Chitinophagales bacterium]
VIGLSGSDSGALYTLLEGGVLPVNAVVTGTGSAISFGSVTPAGYYKVMATSIYGCQSFMTDSVIVRQINNPQINSVLVNEAVCSKTGSGSIIIHASTQNGGIYYSIDSAVTFQPGGSFDSLYSAFYYIVVQDDSGCSTQYSGNPVHVSEPPALTLLLQGRNPDCYGNNTGSVTAVVSGGISPYSYLWNTTPPETSFGLTNLAGDQTYSVTVTDDNGCTVQGAQTLSQPPALVITTVPANVRCFRGNNGRVSVSVSGGTPPYQYFLNGIFQTDSVYTGLTAGSYTLIVQDNNNCNTNQTFTITEPQAFVVNAGPDLTIIKGQTVQLYGTASSNNGILGYLWTPDTSLSCTVCPNPYANPDSTITYVLIATDGDSCLGYDSVTVYVRGVSIFIPTAFTPNGDGLNDYFEFNILGAQNVETTIYNRWGEKIYYNPNQPNGNTNGNAWDGTVNGTVAPTGTYVYQLKITFYDGTTKTETGTITLMR